MAAWISHWKQETSPATLHVDSGWKTLLAASHPNKSVVLHFDPAAKAKLYDAPYSSGALLAGGDP